jgi:hypothetical protein
VKYKIGDRIKVNTEIPPGGQKRILIREPSPDSILGNGSYQVVAKNDIMQTYKIIIDDDMLGWYISAFHVEHEKVPVAFKGRKFYDIHLNFVLGEND